MMFLTARWPRLLFALLDLQTRRPLLARPPRLDLRFVRRTPGEDGSLRRSGLLAPPVTGTVVRGMDRDAPGPRPAAQKARATKEEGNQMTRTES